MRYNKANFFKCKFICNCQTKEDYDDLMRFLKRHNMCWINNESPTEFNAWQLTKENTAISISCREPKRFFYVDTRRALSDIKIIVYKKGDFI